SAVRAGRGRRGSSRAGSPSLRRRPESRAGRPTPGHMEACQRAVRPRTRRGAGEVPAMTTPNNVEQHQAQVARTTGQAMTTPDGIEHEATIVWQDGIADTVCTCGRPWPCWVLWLAALDQARDVMSHYDEEESGQFWIRDDH